MKYSPEPPPLRMPRHEFQVCTQHYSTSSGLPAILKCDALTISEVSNRRRHEFRPLSHLWCSHNEDESPNSCHAKLLEVFRSTLEPIQEAED